MPWRQTKDLYAIWTSEVMLQQTKVKTVRPYFEKWMEKFPTIRDLAQATQADVLSCWQGLGYYNRAKNFHRAAQIIYATNGGQIPKEIANFRKLPGVGEYISAAVMSIGLNCPSPALDGNVKRVVSRILEIADETSTIQFKKTSLQFLNKAISAKRPGDFNQAMMELGATVCTPNNPRCNQCPVSLHCASFEHQTQHQFPNRKKQKRLPHFDVVAGIIYQNGKILISQRPQKGMLGGLWEFPGGKQEKNETLNECLTREIQEELGIDILVGEKFQTISHAYSHFKITLHVFECTWIVGEPQAIECDDFCWIDPLELDKFPFPATDLQIIQKIQRRHR